MVRSSRRPVSPPRCFYLKFHRKPFRQRAQENLISDLAWLGVTVSYVSAVEREARNPFHPMKSSLCSISSTPQIDSRSFNRLLPRHGRPSQSAPNGNRTMSCICSQLWIGPATRMNSAIRRRRPSGPFWSIAAVFVATSLAIFAQNPVAQIPPHPLDGAFASRLDNNVLNGILNNPHFKKAVEEAAKAKREAEAFLRKNPGVAAPSPERAARARFLEVLSNNGAGAVGAAPKK
jgi:hypothetical protein